MQKQRKAEAEAANAEQRKAQQDKNERKVSLPPPPVKEGGAGRRLPVRSRRPSLIAAALAKPGGGPRAGAPDHARAVTRPVAVCAHLRRTR